MAENEYEQMIAAGSPVQLHLGSRCEGLTLAAPSIRKWPIFASARENTEKPLAVLIKVASCHITGSQLHIIRPYQALFGPWLCHVMELDQTCMTAVNQGPEGTRVFIPRPAGAGHTHARARACSHIQPHCAWAAPPSSAHLHCRRSDDAGVNLWIKIPNIFDHGACPDRTCHG